MQAVHLESMERVPEIADIARQHYTAVFRFCARRIGIDAAQDAAQETFLTAQRALRKFRGNSTLLTWLLGIAHNECRRIARNRRLIPPPIEIDDHGIVPAFDQRIIDRSFLEEALNRLSPEHREVLLLHEIDGLSYEEAALVIGVPVGTVKSRLHHAFLSLRKALHPMEGQVR